MYIRRASKKDFNKLMENNVSLSFSKETYSLDIVINFIEKTRKTKLTKGHTLFIDIIDFMAKNTEYKCYSIIRRMNVYTMVVLFQKPKLYNIINAFAFGMNYKEINDNNDYYIPYEPVFEIYTAYENISKRVYDRYEKMGNISKLKYYTIKDKICKEILSEVCWYPYVLEEDRTKLI